MKQMFLVYKYITLKVKKKYITLKRKKLMSFLMFIKTYYIIHELNQVRSLKFNK